MQTTYVYKYVSDTEYVILARYDDPNCLERIVDEHNMDEFIAAGGVPVTEPWAPDVPTPQQLILQQIAALEAQITVRRTREAILGTDGGWLANIDAEIAALRAQL